MSIYNLMDCIVKIYRLQLQGEGKSYGHIYLIYSVGSQAKQYLCEQCL